MTVKDIDIHYVLEALIYVNMVIDNVNVVMYVYLAA